MRCKFCKHWKQIGLARGDCSELMASGKTIFLGVDFVKKTKRRFDFSDEHRATLESLIELTTVETGEHFGCVYFEPH